MGDFGDGPTEDWILLVLAVIGVGTVSAEAVVVEGGDVSLGGLLVAAFRVPSVLTGTIAAGLLHPAEEFGASHWTLD